MSEPILNICKTRFHRNKKADIWVSTVLYSLIAIAIIGTLLAVVRPRINELRDHYLIDQTVNSFNQIDEKVTEVKSATGMRLNLQFQLNRGTLTFNTTDSTIEWNLPDSEYQYSEEGYLIKIGNIEAQTKASSGKWGIMLRLNYSELNMSFADEYGVIKNFEPSSTPYKIWIFNKGKVGAKTGLDFKVY